MADPDLSQFMAPPASDEPDLSQFMGVSPDKPYPAAKKSAGTMTDSDRKWLARQKPNAVDRTMAAVRSATREAFPTATGAAGAATGAGIGALAPPPFDLATVPIGTLVGGVLGGMSGKKAQTGALSMVPKVAKTFGQDPRQVALDERDYPVTTALSGFAPGLVAGGALQKAMTPADLLEKPLLTAPKTPSRVDKINAVREAADRQGIKLPTTTTSPVGYRASRILPKVAGLNTEIDVAEAAAPKAVGVKLSDIASRYGLPTEPGEAGAKVQDAAGRWAEKQRVTGADLLEQANAKGAGIPIVPQQTLAYIDQTLADLERTPAASRGEIHFLNGVKSDLSGESPPDLATLRQLRSSWYKNQDPGGLLPSAKNKLAGDLWHALSGDINSGLTAEHEGGNAAAAEALDAFNQGNKVWSERADTIKSTLGKIFGTKVNEDSSDPLNSVFVADKPPEDAAAAIAKMAGGDRRGLKTLMGTLDADAQDTVRASTIASLGRDGAGNFDATIFLKNMHEIPETTREILFGKENLTAMNDLETIVKNIKDMPARRGGMGALGMEMAIPGMMGLHGGVEGAGAGLALVGGGNLAVAHFLSRPDSLKWVAQLVKAASKGSDAVAPVVERLGKAADNNAMLYPLYEAVTKGAAAALTPKAPKSTEPAPEVYDPSKLSDEELGIEPSASAQGPTDEHVTLDPTAYENKPVEELIPAVIHQESRGNPDAISPKGAIGQMQLMPETAKDLGVDPHDPVQNVEGGTRHLTSLIERYHGNQTLGLMAYNWGARHVDDWIKNGMRGGVPKETRDYVHNILGRSAGQP